mmetsp:Transcript_35098/g.46192  ORF Transcript_35098/g.46192 Transcript_35098/m.46192 type:complete len:170 (+) Transcript_35098:29-538(+)|eukprot:CAMPEP_0170466944 /NCGR_PEP_ID=MMETSP0123-20130129/10710_1 /TAXON_ID=182087 /ORGANISM="Favella ehrenbergii, Strain Fehren 1" /LENGTH=169 /DNA_ID=CAMNT_0010733191 /DNA_START=13 /DNA_END=522 /DNA_ORIENTATION=+
MAMRSKPGASNKGEVLTDVMIAEIREIFSLFDKDADGFVQRSDLGTIVRGLNLNPSETEVLEMMQDVDPENRGSFNQNALCSLIARRPKEEQTLEDIVEALRLVAEDVGVDKLQTKMQIVTFKDQITKLGKEKGEQLLGPQVDEIINDCKLDHDGDILIEDFAKYLLSK